MDAFDIINVLVIIVMLAMIVLGREGSKNHHEIRSTHLPLIDHDDTKCL